MNPIDITKLTVVELKALAYEEMLKIEGAQRNLQVLQQEINKRLQEQKVA